MHIYKHSDDLCVAALVGGEIEKRSYVGVLAAPVTSDKGLTDCSGVILELGERSRSFSSCTCFIIIIILVESRTAG